MFSRSIIDNSRSINDTSRVTRMTIVNDASSFDNSKGVIYDCSIFILWKEILEIRSIFNFYTSGHCKEILEIKSTQYSFKARPF